MFSLMKLVIRLAHPDTDKGRMFRLEVPVEDWKNPGEAWVVINGTEYKIEVDYEEPLLSYGHTPQPAIF